MENSPPNSSERPPPRLMLLALLTGLLAGTAYWALLYKLGQPVNGIHVAAIGVCAAIATTAVPRLRRLSPEAREAAQRDPAVAEAGSFGAVLDRIYLDTPTSMLAGFVILFGLLDLFALTGIAGFLIIGDPEGALFGSIALSAFFTLLMALPARAMWRRRKARRKVGFSN